MESLGPCAYCSREGVERAATRRTPWGDLCDAHRKRTQPSRAGGKKLFESVAKREELETRFWDAVYDLRDADEDEDYERSRLKVTQLGRLFFGSDPANQAKVEGIMSDARRRSIRLGMRKAAKEGRLPGPHPTITGEQVKVALEQAGGVQRRAAALLGRPLASVQRAMTRNGINPSHGKMHALGGKPSVPAAPHTEASQGEVHAVEARKVEGRVQLQRERADEEREAAETSLGNRLSREG